MNPSASRLPPAPAGRSARNNRADAETECIHVERSPPMSEDLYRSLVESLPGNIFRKDLCGRFIFANGRFCAMLGRPLADIVGKTDFDLYPWQLAEKYRQDDRLVLLTGETLETTEEHRTADGRRLFVQVIKTTVHDHRGVIVGTQGVFWDVAECGQAEEALCLERGRMEKAERALRANDEEFRIGRLIQQGLYPRAAPAIPGFDIAGASFPATATGGDYFDFVPMLAGCLGIVVGDASGHGVGPALLSASTRAYLRALALTHVDVGEVLTGTNQLLAGDISEDHFVTVFLGQLNPRTHSFAYASAGHQTAYAFESTGVIKDRLKSTGFPLGVDPGTAVPAGHTIVLEAGDLLLLLTDGIAEATDLEEDQFHVNRALEVVRSNRNRPAREIIERLCQAARDFCHPRVPQDDMTAVVIKVNA